MKEESMNYLNSYLRSKLDLSNIGLQRGEKESGYFCTPVLSKVIGWAGVDGIHFCTTKGFDEMIFAVNPTYEPGDYVHPVAKNFEDFLRLLLACYDTAAIEQCWFMDREVFERFVEENQPTAEGKKCLDEIRKKYKLTPMEDPFAYMQDLHHSFDYTQLKFPPEYYEVVEEPTEPVAPEWRVTWDGDFFHNEPDDIAAEPVKVDTSFCWAGIDWVVPEVYPFDKGVIVYLLGSVDPNQVPMDAYEGYISAEVHERMMAENPLNIHVRHELSINDLILRPTGGMGITWIPDQNWNTESKWVLEHYELNLNLAWQIHRIKFFWPVCGKMDIEKMSMTMKQLPVPVSGTHFKTPAEGERVILTHPQTGVEYTLTVQEIRQEKADFQNLPDQSMEYPACYTQMFFTIDPALTGNQFRIADCAQSDQPKHRIPPKGDALVSAVSIGIIGGVSGPATIIMGQPNSPEAQIHAANSSLHFAPAKEIEWRIVFQEKPNEDLTISLL